MTSVAPEPDFANASEEEIELIPTLVSAYELQPIAGVPGASLPTSVNNQQWNPQPQWRSDLVGSLPKPESSSEVLAAIPEDYPLAPRLKKEPPTIGNAFANAASIIGQLQPLDAPSQQPISPFMSKPVIATPVRPTQSPPNRVVQNPSAWPDQSYIAKSNSNSNADAVDLRTPHLLTGSIVQPPPMSDLPPSPQSFAKEPAFEAVHRPKSLPKTGNYILQPLRKSDVK